MIISTGNYVQLNQGTLKLRVSNHIFSYLGNFKTVIPEMINGNLVLYPQRSKDKSSDILISKKDLYLFAEPGDYIQLNVWEEKKALVLKASKNIPPLPSPPDNERLTIDEWTTKNFDARKKSLHLPSDLLNHLGWDNNIRLYFSQNTKQNILKPLTTGFVPRIYITKLSPNKTIVFPKSTLLHFTIDKNLLSWRIGLNSNQKAIIFENTIISI
jgi:hypothetical protein